MRKIFLKSMITVLLLTSFGGMDAYAEDAGSSGFDERCTLLHELGILENTDLPDTGYVTRGEFVSAAVRLRGIEYSSDDDSGIYADVNNKHPYYKDIMAASVFGLICGGSDGNFMPDEVITSEQAGLILARVLGYTDINGAQQDLKRTVERSGVLCGYNEMTWNNVTYILTEMLDRKVIVCTLEDEKAKYTADSETVLEKYRSIYKLDGIVQGVHDTYIGGLYSLGENRAEIDGIGYETGEINLSDYVGHRIKGYYYEDKSSGTYTVISAADYKTQTLTIQADDLKSYENRVLEYYDGARLKRAEADINLDVLYNGRYYADFTAPDMIIDAGKVILIDNDNDGVYEVADIREYQTYIVDGVDLQNKKIYLQYAGEKYIIDLSRDSDAIDFSDTSGNPVDIREIMRNDVLCVYESRQGEYVRIIMCTKELEGIIESAGEDTVTIDGTEYDVTKNCLKNQSVYLKPGVKGVFVRDIEGYICYITAADSGEHFAYVINSVFDEDTERVLFKLMLDSGEIKNYYVRDKAALDSYSYKSSAKLWEAIGGMSFRHRLIKCAISNDEITKICTAGNAENGGLEMYYTDYEYTSGIPKPNSDTHKRTFRSASMTIGGKVAISGNTIVMIVPDDPAETSDKYYAVDNTYIENDKDYRVEAYRDSVEDYTADILVIYDDVSSDYEPTNNDIGINVLGNVIDAIDEDDDKTYMLEIFDGGVMKQYMLRDPDMLGKVYGDYTPSKGDVIRYELKNNKINKLELIYSVKAGRIVAPANRTNETNTNHYQQFRVWDAYVFYRWGSFMMLSETMPSDWQNYNYMDYDIHPCASSSIIICEQGKKRDMDVYAGTSDDIIGYKNTAGAECSKVVVYERWGDGKTIVIYR